MNFEQYRSLTAAYEPSARTISVSDLEDTTPRTLIYGYTGERDTFHLYLDADDAGHPVFVRVLYDHDGIALEPAVKASALPLPDCAPSKRVYAECSDFAFCRILKDKGVDIPFTSFTPREELKTFYGLREAELLEIDLADLKVPMFDLPVDTIRETFKTVWVERDVLNRLFNDIRASCAGQLEGYVRAALVRNNRTVQWLTNLPLAVEHHIERAFFFDTPAPHFKLPEDVRTLLIDLAQATVDAHLERVGERVSANAKSPRM